MAQQDFYFNNLHRSYPFLDCNNIYWNSLFLEFSLVAIDTVFGSYPLCRIVRTQNNQNNIIISFLLFDYKTKATQSEIYDLIINKYNDNGELLSIGTIVQFKFDTFFGYYILGDLENFNKISNEEIQQLNSAYIQLIPTRLKWYKDYKINSISFINVNRKRLLVNSQLNEEVNYGDMPIGSSDLDKWYPEPEHIQVKTANVVFQAGTNCSITQKDNKLSIDKVEPDQLADTSNISLGYYYNSKLKKYMPEIKPTVDGETMKTFSGLPDTDKSVICVNNCIGPNIKIVGENVVLQPDAEHNTIQVKLQ